jgi:hypothetical protein
MNVGTFSGKGDRACSYTIRALNSHSEVTQLGFNRSVIIVHTMIDYGYACSALAPLVTTVTHRSSISCVWDCQVGACAALWASAFGSWLHSILHPCHMHTFKEPYPSYGRAVAQAVSRRLPNRSDLGSRPGQVMWDLWWTDRLWGRFSPSTSVLSATNCSTVITIYHPGLVQ